MRQWTRLSILFALACGLLSAQSNGVQFYTVEKEIALGKRLAEDTRERTTPLDDARVQDYASRIGKRLTAQANVPFPWNFEVVVGLPDNPTHEPVELPGGFVFLSADLLLAAHDEDELAGMLAHSIAHIASRDMTRSALSGQLQNYGTIPLVFIGGWQSGLAVPKAFWEMQTRFEAAADLTAVGMMRRAGYDPQAFLRYVARVQPEQISGQWPFPQRDARIAALEAAIRELGANDFVKMQDSIRGQVGEPVSRKVPSLFR